MLQDVVSDCPSLQNHIFLSLLFNNGGSKFKSFIAHDLKANSGETKYEKPGDRDNDLPFGFIYKSKLVSVPGD